MTKQNIQPPVNDMHRNLDEYENTDFLDLIELKRCSAKRCQKSKLTIGCPNCRLSNVQNLQYYLKHKQEVVKIQTVDYKSNFKEPCFNCSSSFHGSSYEDGHFNLQKIFDNGKKCGTCQRNFTRKRSFYHNCNTCMESYKNCRSLLRHRRIKHKNSNKPHQCAACNISLGIKEIFPHIHTHKIPNVCSYCNKRTTDLKLHMLSHTGDFHLFEDAGDNNFNCDVCYKYFARQETLDQHKLIHMEKSYQCNYCLKHFKTKNILDIHLFEHIAVDQFKCDLCNKYFTRQYSLTQHQRYHHIITYKNTRKPRSTSFSKPGKDYVNPNDNKYIFPLYKFKCDVCDKSYARKHWLALHKAFHIP